MSSSSSSDSAVPRTGWPWLQLPTGAGTVLADALRGARVRDLVLVTSYALLVGLSAQIVLLLPFTPVPFTGQTFAVLLGAAALGWRRAMWGMILYTVVGVAGVPWFSSWSGGYEVLFAPSFGYILGFVVAALIVGGMAGHRLDRTVPRALGTMLVGTLLIYAFGVPWLMVTLGVGLVEGLVLGVVPFLLSDLLKALLAAGILPGAWSLLRRFG